MRMWARVFAPAGTVETPGAVVRVRVLDVSRIDAASTTLAQGVRAADRVEGAAGGVVVELDVPAVDPSAEVALAAHVDRSGSGEVELGDLVTMRHVGVDLTAPELIQDLPVQEVVG